MLLKILHVHKGFRGRRGQQIDDSRVCPRFRLSILCGRPLLRRISSNTKRSNEPVRRFFMVIGLATWTGHERLGRTLHLSRVEFDHHEVRPEGRGADFCYMLARTKCDKDTRVSPYTTKTLVHPCSEFHRNKDLPQKRRSSARAN